MPFLPKWVDSLPDKKDAKGRGRKGAPYCYRKALRENPGRWGVMATHNSSLAANLVANFWGDMYPELEFEAVGRTIYARFMV
jgi:hypothetical protein